MGDGEATAVPQLKSATVDPKKTALLILDLMAANCGARPRCVSTGPNIKKLLDTARGHNMMVFYTMDGPDPNPEGMGDQNLRAREGGCVRRGGCGQFLRCG